MKDEGPGMNSTPSSFILYPSSLARIRSWPVRPFVRKYPLATEGREMLDYLVYVLVRISDLHRAGDAAGDAAGRSPAAWRGCSTT